ncbi:MAG: UDP-N-acetylglucosamine 2-epimerase [Nitriliruptorales bacterium]
MATVHVFIGTKAQYIKTAPVLRLMDARGVEYRLIDSGQHAALATGLRAELGVRAPDRVLGGDRDITSIPRAITWSAGLAARLLSRRRLLRDVFAGEGGVCVVHGDTPSTLLSTLMARRAGLAVAHLEAGLRSHDLLHPFPEELVRVLVMRVADLLFAPDATAIAHLAGMRTRGQVVPLPANTSLEAVRHALGGRLEVAPTGPVLVTMHRVENLHRPARVRGFVDLACRIAEDRPVRFVVHGPTRPVLERHRLIAPLERAGVELSGLVGYETFVRHLAAAPFAVVDGGSIQEECALLGVPTLLWRGRTERPDGLGENVVLGRYDPATVDAFLADPERLRRPPASSDLRPSETILDTILETLDPGRL